MNRKQSDKLGSLLKSYGVLKDNAGALAGLPMVVAHTGTLKTYIDRLFELAGLIEQDSSGYAIDKQDKREALTDTLLRLCRLALAYYIGTGNEEMQKTVSITAGRVSRMSGAHLYLFAQKMHESLVADAPLMPGTAPADIGKLAVDITAFYKQW